MHIRIYIERERARERERACWNVETQLPDHHEHHHAQIDTDSPTVTRPVSDTG